MQQPLRLLVDLLQSTALDRKLGTFRDMLTALQVYITMNYDDSVFVLNLINFQIDSEISNFKSPQFSIAPNLKSGIAANVIFVICVL